MHGGRLGSASHRGPVAAPPAPAARAVSGNLLAAGKPAGDVSGPMLGTAMFDVACLALGPAAPAQQLQARLKELHLAQVEPVAPRGSMGGTGGSDAFSSASRLSAEEHVTGCRPSSPERSSVGCGSHTATYRHGLAHLRAWRPCKLFLRSTPLHVC